MAEYYQQQGPMGTDRLISDRNGNQEKALELDRSHSEEADQQCHKTSLEMEPTGKRKRGQQRNTWRRDLETDMAGSGLSWGIIERQAEDRVGWHELVCSLCSPRSAEANDDDDNEHNNDLNYFKATK